MATKIIAIDGPAASGKGTISKRIAASLDYAHMDTGALYRLVGREVLKAGGDPDNEIDAVQAALDIKKQFWGGMCDDPELRRAEVGDAASKVAVFRLVREVLHNLQIEYATNPPGRKMGSVLDGRDIGTVIAPNADVKLFITASTEVRARRRFKELQDKGFEIKYEQILSDMRARDERDTGRKTAPLIPAKDALTIDTSDLSADEAFKQAMVVVRQKIMS